MHTAASRIEKPIEMVYTYREPGCVKTPTSLFFITGLLDLHGAYKILFAIHLKTLAFSIQLMLNYLVHTVFALSLSILCSQCSTLIQTQDLEQ
jgi:hypothetical protein